MLCRGVVSEGSRRFSFLVITLSFLRCTYVPHTTFVEMTFIGFIVESLSSYFEDHDSEDYPGRSLVSFMVIVETVSQSRSLSSYPFCRSVPTLKRPPYQS